MSQTELESRLLTLLTQPMRVDDIRRALPEAPKQELKKALDRLLTEGRVMKNKKNRYAVSAHYGCVTGTFLATERAFASVSYTHLDVYKRQGWIILHQTLSGREILGCVLMFIAIVLAQLPDKSAAAAK